MRRYLQGTLDFACGIYAVINALSCIYSIPLAEARRLLTEIHVDLAASPDLFRAFCHNETDHYWIVRCMLARVQSDRRYNLDLCQPFSTCLMPGGNDEALPDNIPLGPYLPEAADPEGPFSLDAARQEAEAVWQAVHLWLASPTNSTGKRAAIFRFHRFLPAVYGPVVSHWTTCRFATSALLSLHDASSEQGALLELDRKTLLPPKKERAMVRIVPESVVLLHAQA